MCGNGIEYGKCISGRQNTSKILFVAVKGYVYKLFDDGELENEVIVRHILFFREN